MDIDLYRGKQKSVGMTHFLNAQACLAGRAFFLRVPSLPRFYNSKAKLLIPRIGVKLDGAFLVLVEKWKVCVLILEKRLMMVSEQLDS